MEQKMKYYPTLGLTLIEQPIDAFILDITLYSDNIHPRTYHIEYEDWNPSSYFITSGDALEKSKAMLSDFKQYERDIKHSIKILNGSETEGCALIDLLDKTRTKLETLVVDLNHAKGQNSFLETEWDSHRLLVLVKNPRPR
jgi:hypothetical protein